MRCNSYGLATGESMHVITSFRALMETLNDQSVDARGTSRISESRSRL